MLLHPIHWILFKVFFLKYPNRDFPSRTKTTFQHDIQLCRTEWEQKRPVIRKCGPVLFLLSAAFTAAPPPSTIKELVGHRQEVSGQLNERVDSHLLVKKDFLHQRDTHSNFFFFLLHTADTM